MLKLNKKGVTLIELIVSFALVATAVIYFYQTLSTVYDLYATSRKETQEYVDNDYALRILDAKINEDASSIENGDKSFCNTYTKVDVSDSSKTSKNYCEKIEVDAKSNYTKFNIKKGDKTLTSLVKASVPQILSTDNGTGSAAFYTYFNGDEIMEASNNAMILEGLNSITTYTFDKQYQYNSKAHLKVTFRTKRSDNVGNSLVVFDLIGENDNDLKIDCLGENHGVIHKEYNDKYYWIYLDSGSTQTIRLRPNSSNSNDYKLVVKLDNCGNSERSYVAIDSIEYVYE